MFGALLFEKTSLKKKVDNNLINIVYRVFHAPLFNTPSEIPCQTTLDHKNKLPFDDPFF